MRFKNFRIVVAKSVAVGMLLGSLWLYQDDYFTILRWVVCGVSAFGAFQAAKSSKSGWAWVLALVALFFNPFILVHLRRDTWAVIDIGVALLLLISIGADREAPTPLSLTGVGKAVCKIVIVALFGAILLLVEWFCFDLYHAYYKKPLAADNVNRSHTKPLLSAPTLPVFKTTVYPASRKSIVIYKGQIIEFAENMKEADINAAMQIMIHPDGSLKLPDPTPQPGEEAIPIEEVVKLVGNADLSHGLFAGKLYNGSSWVITRLIFTVAGKGEDGTSLWTRDLSAQVAIEPLKTESFSITVVGEFEFKDFDWSIKTAFGYKK